MSTKGHDPYAHLHTNNDGSYIIATAKLILIYEFSLMFINF